VIVKRWFIAILAVLAMDAHAQDNLTAAQQYAGEHHYDKAADIYSRLYPTAPDSVYTDYLSCLTNSKKYKLAEELVARQCTLRLNNLLHIDLGNVYEREGRVDKAREQYDSLVASLNGDDMYTQKVAKAFENAGLEEYAIATYERAARYYTGPYLYAVQLATIYAKCNDLDHALEALLALNQIPSVNAEYIKSVLLELLGNDADKLLAAKKAIIRKLNEHPENNYFADLLTWIYTRTGDWDGALQQMEAVDERNNENGNHLMAFARNAVAAQEYGTAQKAYEDVVAKGSSQPYYIVAKSEELTAAFNKLKNNPNFTPTDVAATEQLYDSFLLQYPKYYGMQTGADNATVHALYGNDVPGAIAILKKGLEDPDIRHSMAGAFKLQLGDYYILAGELWESSLYYSQVDKDFKQDAMGEDARFRNAKLAYYRGDFDWAQQQLTWLKSATSDLISNDAIYLSVLITENVQDSNTVALQRFAAAGLLMFQNKDKEAEALLDSINQAYPEHPLNDDILMARADLSIKHRNYTKALDYLKTIYEKYGKDVLGDDAVYKMATIYQEDLHDNDNAKHYYEQLIIDYPGSTYAPTARQKLNDLKNASIQ
jgi:predicted Zn-dependent protease